VQPAGGDQTFGRYANGRLGKDRPSLQLLGRLPKLPDCTTSHLFFSSIIRHVSPRLQSCLTRQGCRCIGEHEDAVHHPTGAAQPVMALEPAQCPHGQQHEPVCSVRHTYTSTTCDAWDGNMRRSPISPRAIPNDEPAETSTNQCR
jgi:hypothetical protein